MIIPKNWSTMKKLMFLQQTGGGSVVIEDTVSGNPVVFTTDLAKPLKRLALSLLPRQSGTGDPSPSNIRPLLPWGEVGTWTGGKNLLPNLKVQDTANRVSLGVSAVSDRIFLKAGTYRISFGVTSRQEALAFWMTYGKDGQATSTAKSTNPFTLTEDTLIRIWLYNGNGIPADNVEWWQLESGSQATAYESPTITPHPVNLQKNLLKVTASTTTVNGITYTIESDGTIRLSGTASARSVFKIAENFLIKAGTYKLNGSPVSMPIGCYLNFNYGGGAVSETKGMLDVSFTISEDVTTDYLRFDMASGTVADGLVFKPMIRLATDDDPTYQPYLPPVYGASIDLTTGEVWGTHVGKALTWGDGTNEQSSGEGYKRRRFLFNNAPVVTGSANSISDKCGYNSNSTAQVAHFYVANFDSGDVYVYIFLPNETSETEEITVVSKLQTPVLLATLTPQQVNAIVGVNTVWSDADNIDLTFLKKR